MIMENSFEKRPYEEEFDMVGAFSDKYDSLIEDAPRNSLLGMFRDLDDTLGDVLNAKDEDNIDLIRARENIVHVMLIMAQMWSDENQDIELIATDPSTGEETVIPAPGPYYFKIMVLESSIPKNVDFNRFYLEVDGYRVGYYHVTEDYIRLASGNVAKTLVFKLYDYYTEGYKLQSMWSDEQRFNIEYSYSEHDAVSVLNLITKEAEMKTLNERRAELGLPPIEEIPIEEA